MANNWQGYRSITIDGRRFRWRCSFHHPLEIGSAGYARDGRNWEPDTLVIQQEDEPSRLLKVIWPACKAPLVKPRLVRACIENAFQQGWSEKNQELELDGSTVEPAREAQNADWMSPPTEAREEIWNSFIMLAYNAAADLKDEKAGELRRPGESGGGSLSDEQCRVVRLIIHCVLAVEARANLLLWELCEVQRLESPPTDNNFQQKWGCLENCVDVRKENRRDEAINWLFQYRHKLVHVDFKDLAKEATITELPSAKVATKKYNEILCEIDFMNTQVRKVTFPRTYLTDSTPVYDRWHV